jgi:hypothetical protein
MARAAGAGDGSGPCSMQQNTREVFKIQIHARRFASVSYQIRISVRPYLLSIRAWRSIPWGLGKLTTMNFIVLVRVRIRVKGMASGRDPLWIVRCHLRRSIRNIPYNFRARNHRQRELRFHTEHHLQRQLLVPRLREVRRHLPALDLRSAAQGDTFARHQGHAGVQRQLRLRGDPGSLLPQS